MMTWFGSESWTPHISDGLGLVSLEYGSELVQGTDRAGELIYEVKHYISGDT